MSYQLAYIHFYNGKTDLILTSATISYMEGLAAREYSLQKNTAEAMKCYTQHHFLAIKTTILFT